MKDRVLLIISICLFTVAAVVLLYAVKSEYFTIKYGGIEFIKIINEPFAPLIIGTYEVTQEQFEAVMKKNPSFFSGNPDNPVESVTLHDMILFCIKLSIECNLTPYYWFDENDSTRLIIDPDAGGFRLPTKEEWHKALTVYAAKKFSWGDEVDGDYLWYKENSDGTTHPVGSKKSNIYGIYDLSGNVMEACLNFNVDMLSLCGGDFDTRNEMFFSSGMDFTFPVTDMASKSVGFRIVKNSWPEHQTGCNSD